MMFDSPFFFLSNTSNQKTQKSSRGTLKAWVNNVNAVYKSCHIGLPIKYLIPTRAFENRRSRLGHKITFLATNNEQLIINHDTSTA